PFSRCEAMGEGARSADEGFFAQCYELNERSLLRQRALTRPSGTFSHCFATGEGENLGGLDLGNETQHLRIFPYSRSALVGEGGRRPDEGSFAQCALSSTSVPC